MASNEKDAIKGLQSLSECCICLATYTDPRILSCFHTCCLKCFESIQTKNELKNGDVLPCPLCRKEFTIPPQGMKGLQKNFFIENLIEMMKVLNSNTKRMTCTNCSMVEEAGSISEAKMRCLNCCENYCLRCSKIHQRQKLTKKHTIVEIKSDNQEEYVRNLFPARNCHKHFDRVLDLYCSDCKIVVCVSCFVEDHKLHECKDVKTVDKVCRRRLEINSANISNLSEQILRKKLDVERQQQEYLKHVFSTEKAILTKSQQLKELIDQHSNILLDELQVMKQKHQKIMETEIEEIERNLTVLGSFVTYCTQLKSKGSPTELCGSFDNLNTRAKELSVESEKLLNASRISVEIEFVPIDQNVFLHDISNVIGSLSGSVRQFENYAVVIGINNGISIFDEVIKINLDQPEKVSSLPPIPTEMTMAAAAAVYSNKIFVAGLGKNMDEIWRFDAASSSWKQCASLICGRWRHCLAFVNQVLYICGGYVDHDESILDDVESYDASDDKCTTVGKLKYAVMSSHNCVSFKDSLYIFGGLNAKNNALSSIQEYDTKTNTCSLLSKPMPRADALVHAILWNNSAILLSRLGCLIYNFDTETWQVRDRFKTDVAHFGLSSAEGKLFVLGGGTSRFDLDGSYKWDCRDDVRWIPIVNILNDEPTEWKHHSSLPAPSLVHAFAVID